MVSLDASRRYDLAVSWSDPPTTECVGELLDAGGAAVARTGYDGESPAQILSFRPGRSGKHQLRVKCTLYGDGGAPYRVSLTRR